MFDTFEITLKHKDGERVKLLFESIITSSYPESWKKAIDYAIDQLDK